MFSRLWCAPYDNCIYEKKPSVSHAIVSSSHFNVKKQGCRILSRNIYQEEYFVPLTLICLIGVLGAASETSGLHTWRSNQPYLLHISVSPAPSIPNSATPVSLLLVSDLNLCHTSPSTTPVPHFLISAPNLSHTSSRPPPVPIHLSLISAPPRTFISGL